jgi:hypothetical protein
MTIVTQKIEKIKASKGLIAYLINPNMNIIVFGKTLDHNNIFGGISYITNMPFSFEETVARLYNLANYNIFEVDGPESTFNIIGKFNDMEFVLKDYYGNHYCIIIHYDRKLDINLLKKHLIELIQKTNPKRYIAYYNKECIYSYPALDQLFD